MGSLAISIITVFLLVGIGEMITVITTINQLRHIRSGAWWVVVVIWTCTLASCFLLCCRRFYSSLLLAIGTAAVALLGAILDARSSLQFSLITACASRGDIYPYKDIIYSGKSSDYLVAQSCFNSTEYIESDGCYCVSNNNPRSCTEYIRYSEAKSSVDDYGIRTYYTCYDTVKTYYGSMTASCVFCCLLFLFALLYVLFLSLSRWKCMPGVCT